MYKCDAALNLYHILSWVLYLFVNFLCNMLWLINCLCICLQRIITSNNICACFVYSYASILHTHLCLAHYVALQTKRTLQKVSFKLVQLQLWKLHVWKRMSWLLIPMSHIVLSRLVHVVNSVRSASAINTLFRSHSEAMCVHHKFM